LEDGFNDFSVIISVIIYLITTLARDPFEFISVIIYLNSCNT